MSENTGLFNEVERGVNREYVGGYDFPVELVPLITSTENSVEVPDRRAVLRTDTNVVLGTVGSNYKLLTHGEALDPIIHALEKKGEKTFKRITTTNGGARLFANIYFPNQETKVGKVGGDTYWPGITVVNSLDGTLKYSLEASIFRLICTNGMRVPTKVAGSTSVHSKNKNFDHMIEQILSFVGDGTKFTILQDWANKILTPEKMITLADKIIDGKNSIFPARYRTLVHAEIDKESKSNVVSVWGLYNAFNSVIEHHIVREKGKYDRARLLDENLFKSFEKTFPVGSK